MKKTTSKICFAVGLLAILLSTIEGNDVLFPLGCCILILGFTRLNR